MNTESVDSLINHPFYLRSTEEKKVILMRGRPRPVLKALKRRNAFTPVTFDVGTYEQVKWLTGCTMRQALFCWPCLLEVSLQKEEWNFAGVSDIHNLKEKINSHEKSIMHLQATLQLQLSFKKFKIDTLFLSQQKNDLVKRNREIARRLIDSICFLASQQKCPRSGTGDTNFLQLENCVETFTFLRDYDLLNTSLIDDAIDMLQIAPKIVADMTDSITDVMKMSMLKEVHKSTYASLILSDHYSDPLKSQYSTVLRYLKEGQVCERFIGFTNTYGSRTPSSIFNHINNVITDFQIPRRIAAYSMDSSLLLQMKSINEVKLQLQYRHPYLVLLPCYFHNLEAMLKNTISQECIFFKNVEDMKILSEENSQVHRLLEEFFRSRSICEEVPNFDISKARTGYAEFFTNIKLFNIHLVDFCDSIMDQNLKIDNVAKLYGIRKFLTDFKTYFLIETYIRLFDLVTPLTQASESHVPGLVFDDILVKSVLNSFPNFSKNNPFDSIWCQVCVDYDKLLALNKRNIKPRQGRNYLFSKLFFDISKQMIDTIRLRYENVQKMTFFQILNLKGNSDIGESDMMPLVSFYGNAFQLGLLITDTITLVKNSPISECQSADEMLQFLRKSNLQPNFPNFYKFCELFLSLPCTLPTAGANNATLQRINSWSYIPDKPSAVGDLSVLCVEYDFLEEIKKKPNFYDEVMTKFQKRNKTINLIEITGTY